MSAPAPAPRVLLVDDEPLVLEALVPVVRGHAEVEVAGGGAEALTRMRAGRAFSVVVSDMRMPGMNGATLLACARREFPETIRVMLTGEEGVDAAASAINDGGVFRFLVKPCAPDVLLATLSDAFDEHRRIIVDREHLRDAVGRSVRSLALAVDARDPSTHRHSHRVGALAAEIAATLGWPAERVLEVRQAGEVHDVGKIGIPDRILLGAEPLSAPEREQMASHCAIGERIVREFMTAEQASWVRGHHERPDGLGYPDGLAGEAIPDGARVLTVADVWDVMTTGRAYASAIPRTATLEEMRRLAGAQFWSPAVDALARLVGEGRLPIAEVRE